MSKRDADFSQLVANIIASRAGYRCSFLGCDESTIGPGAGSTDIERKGVAAHIFAASSGSAAPRGTGGLTPEQRSSATNGIWLCQDHSRIIDNDLGANYPAPTLFAWKALHEAKIGRELRKMPSSNVGWLERVTVLNSPLFAKNTSLTLGKVTLIIGENGVGKSALCDWLSGCACNANDLWRWSSDRNDANIDLALKVVTMENTEATISFSNYNIKVEYAGRRAIDLSRLVRIIHITDSASTLGQEKFEDDLEYLARVWRIHPFQVSDLVSRICNPKFGPIRTASFRTDELVDDDDEVLEVPEHIRKVRHGRAPLTLWVSTEFHDFELDFMGLSGAERTMFIMAGALVLADDYSTFQSVLLLIDMGTNLDDANLSRYAEKLQGSNFQFQTILVSPSKRPKIDWTGWSVARLEGIPPCVHFEQNVVQVNVHSDTAQS